MAIVAYLLVLAATSFHWPNSCWLLIALLGYTDLIPMEIIPSAVIHNSCLIGFYGIVILDFVLIQESSLQEFVPSSILIVTSFKVLASS